MSQDLFFGLPVPIVLALSMLVLVLFIVLRVLASMGKPQRVRQPCRMGSCDAEQEEAAWRF